MAATTGPRGQRKVFSFKPRLTGKAIVPIGHFLNNELCPEIAPNNVEACRLTYQKNAESAFLTGIALCHLWERGLAGTISEELYDMNFMSADVAPMECVENFLSTKGFDEPFGVLLERSLRNGTTTLDAPPVEGLYRIEDISEEDFKRLFPNVSPYMEFDKEIEQWTTFDKNEVISSAIYFYIKHNVFDWDVIIWALALQLRQNAADDYDIDVDPILKETRRSASLYNNLDQAVSDLFAQGGFAAHPYRYHRIVQA